MEVLRAWNALWLVHSEDAALSTRPIPKAAETFVAAVLSLTKAAVAGDVLEVRRMPKAESQAPGSSPP